MTKYYTGLFVLCAALGGGCRALIQTHLPHLGDFPIASLVINLSGAFALAYWIKGRWTRQGYNEHLLLAIGTGFLGSFTSFSGIFLDCFQLCQGHHALLAILYFILSIGLGTFIAHLAYEGGQA